MEVPASPLKKLKIVLMEVESVINAKPLTYVHDDAEGVSYALMPPHLMHCQLSEQLSVSNREYLPDID